MVTTSRKKQLSSALLHFYQNPVAKVSMELFLSIGLVLFLGAFAIRPTLVTMSNLLKEIDDKRQHNTLLERKIAALNTAQNEYRRVEERLPLLNQAIPEEPELIHNLKIIEKIAVDNQVVIQNLSVNEIPAEENNQAGSRQKELTNLPLNMSVMGDYLAIRGFVAALQANRRAVVVDSVTFSLSDSDDNRELSARMTMSFPYFGVVVKK